MLKILKLALLDWDDTLIPCTTCKGKKIANYSSELQSIETNAIKFFRAIKDSKFRPFIITNATLDWIHLTSKWVPLLTEYLASEKIYSISAREKYSSTYDEKQWKCKAFEEIIKIHVAPKNNEIKPLYDMVEIIVVGDSPFEEIAVAELRSKFPYNIPAIIKFVKFINQPDINYLSFQLDSLVKKWNNFVDTPNDIDLEFFALPSNVDVPVKCFDVTTEDSESKEEKIN
jgi:hypothetical protein